MSQLDEENVLIFFKCGRGTRPCACWWSFVYGHYSPCHLVLYYQIRINYWMSVGLVSERLVGISIYICIHTMINNNILVVLLRVNDAYAYTYPNTYAKYKRILGSDNVTASCPSFRWNIHYFKGFVTYRECI